MTEAPAGHCNMSTTVGDYVMVNGNPTDMQNAVAIKPNSVAI